MEEPTALHIIMIVLFVPLLLALIAGWFLFVVFLISRIGGWHRLAKAFRTEVERPGRATRTSMRCGAFGRYNGCVYVGALPEGLHVSMMLPFSVGHPPVLLPWQSLRVVQRQNDFLGSRTQVAVGDVTKIWFLSDALSGTPLDARSE